MGNTFIIRENYILDSGNITKNQAMDNILEFMEIDT